MWTLHRQQQQRGAQMHARGKSPGQRGEVPAEAMAGREAQDHEHAGDEALQPGDYPASAIANADHDNTPSAPEPHVAWDAVVQPERGRGEGTARDEQPLPEGK